MALEPSWVHLINSCIKREASPTARFLQLATLTELGEASCRTVVFRGWHTAQDTIATPSLKIVTDNRSGKISGLRKYPRAEACWYFTESRKQFRLTGNVTVIDSEEGDGVLSRARLEQWHQLPASARTIFACPPPGLAAEDPLSEEQKQVIVESEHPVEYFALLLLKPTRVDVVDLRANERQLFEIEENTKWSDKWLNP